MNNYDELVKKIVVAREKELPEATFEEIIRELKTVPWQTAKSIVDNLCLRESMPRNVYGVIVGEIRDYNRKYQKRQLESEQWKAEKNCVTVPEWRVFWRCMAEIMWWHRLKMVNLQSPVLDTTQPDFEERFDSAWQAGSFPKTKSDLIDNFLAGYHRAYMQDIEKPGALQEYMSQWGNHCRNVRMQKQEAQAVKTK